ncbi:PREDICTED: WAS/WASL-interacting protein family member 2-like [Cercocebus atys]|uniref:WAS/WASL-interacting protein family member 2-like n=1 Tax=Cercocebus atys TaxID=9531 RepID=UPI0005F44F9B|nr:PREDICTED: WAS/WASL-interacting protein family member 2-like [Cercocebus atys]
MFPDVSLELRTFLDEDQWGLECQSVRLYSRARAGPSNSSVSSVVCVPSACTPGSSERTQDNAFPVSAFNLQHNPAVRSLLPSPTQNPCPRPSHSPTSHQLDRETQGIRTGGSKLNPSGRPCGPRGAPAGSLSAPGRSSSRHEGGAPVRAEIDAHTRRAGSAAGREAAACRAETAGWAPSAGGARPSAFRSADRSSVRRLEQLVGRRTGSPIPGPPNVARGSGPRPHPLRGPSWRAHAPHATPPGAPAPLRGLSTLRPEVGWETAKGDVHVIETKVGCLAARRHPVCGGRALPPHPEPPPRHLPTSPVRVAGGGEKPHGRTAALPKGSRDEPALGATCNPNFAQPEQVCRGEKRLVLGPHHRTGSPPPPHHYLRGQAWPPAG